MREKQKLIVQGEYEKKLNAKEKQRNIYIGIGLLVLFS
jgi:hypothetical protein